MVFCVLILFFVHIWEVSQLERENKLRILELENQKLKDDLEDMQILHENTIDHSSELENELVDQNERLDTLQVKMKKYLSPQLFKVLLGGSEEAKISHTRKKLTIFFSDIVGFTKITDSVESEVLSEALNKYLNSMAEVAAKWGGTIDKFIGDAVMVFFGDPEFIDDKTHAVKCILMALEMKDQLKNLKKEWKDIGFHHDLKIRMGVNTGYCTVGNFGSAQRMDYTIVGGQVNIAARLESCAVPNSIYISRATYDLVKDDIRCEYVDDVTVKGIHTPVEVYTCLGTKDMAESSYFQREKDGFILEEIKYTAESNNKSEIEVILKSLKDAISYIEKNIGN